MSSSEADVTNPEGKRKKPVKTLALGAEGTGLEQSLDSLGNSNISNVLTHNPTHDAPLPKHEASSIALEELIALWPTLTLASQIRIYELAQSEAARIASDVSAKRGAK